MFKSFIEPFIQDFVDLFVNNFIFHFQKILLKQDIQDYICYYGKTSCYSISSNVAFFVHSRLEFTVWQNLKRSRKSNCM